MVSLRLGSSLVARSNPFANRFFNFLRNFNELLDNFPKRQLFSKSFLRLLTNKFVFQKFFLYPKTEKLNSYQTFRKKTREKLMPVQYFSTSGKLYLHKKTKTEDFSNDLVCISSQFPSIVLFAYCSLPAR